MITPILQEAVASAAPAFTKPIEPGAKAIYSRDGSRVITVPRVRKTSSSSATNASPAGSLPERNDSNENDDEYSDFDPDDIQYVAGDNIDFEYVPKDANTEEAKSAATAGTSSSKKKKKKKKKSKNSSAANADADAMSNTNSVQVHKDGNGITINNIDFSSPQSIVSAATAAAEVAGGGSPSSAAMISNHVQQQYKQQQKQQQQQQQQMQQSSKKSAGSSKKQNKGDRIWDTSSEEERERIKEFWLTLSEDERRDLVKIEKDTVLQIMKDQQRNSCSCSVCGRKRIAIEEELEALYDAYYAELEMYSEKGVPQSFGKGLPLANPYGHDHHDDYDHAHLHGHGHGHYGHNHGHNHAHNHGHPHGHVHNHDHHHSHNHNQRANRSRGNSHSHFTEHEHEHGPRRYSNSVSNSNGGSNAHSPHSTHSRSYPSHSHGHFNHDHSTDQRIQELPDNYSEGQSLSEDEYIEEEYESDEVYDGEDDAQQLYDYDNAKKQYLDADQDEQEHVIHLMEHHREELEAAGVDFKSKKPPSRADYVLFQSILKGRRKHNMDGGPCNTKIWPPEESDVVVADAIRAAAAASASSGTNTDNSAGSASTSATTASLNGNDDNSVPEAAADEAIAEGIDGTGSSSASTALAKVPTEASASEPTGGDSDLYNFGSSLTIQGGILTVADDLIKNNGKNFIDMMEELAGRRMAREEEALAAANEYEEEYDDEEGEDDEHDYLDEEEEEEDDDVDYIDEYDDEMDDEYDDDEYDDEEDDPPVSEEQRMAEGRRMLQIFAARMFEQRVLNAYREKVAQERQKKLLEELEEENRLKEERELKKLKEKEKKKDKKRQQKLAKEEEKARKEAEKAQAEAALKAEQAKKQELARQKKLEQKKLQEEERKKKLEEERKREAERERKRREREEKENQRRREKEAKEAEARRLRAEEEARVKKAKEEEAEKKRLAKEAEELRKKQEKEAQEEDARRIQLAQETVQKTELAAKQQHQKQLLASLQMHQQLANSEPVVSTSTATSSSGSPQSGTPIALPTLPHSMTQPIQQQPYPTGQGLPPQQQQQQQQHLPSSYGQLPFQQAPPQQQPQQQPGLHPVAAWNSYLTSASPGQAPIPQPPAMSNTQSPMALLNVLGYTNGSSVTSPSASMAQPLQTQPLLQQLQQSQQQQQQQPRQQQQQQQPPIKRPSAASSNQDLEDENPVDELNRIIGGSSLLEDDESNSAFPINTSDVMSPITNATTANVAPGPVPTATNGFGSGRLFSGSLFDTKTSSSSSDWSPFGRRTSSIGSNMWSTSGTPNLNMNSINGSTPWNTMLPQQLSQQPVMPSHQPPPPQPSLSHYPSSHITIYRAAMAAYQTLAKDGWTNADGYVPAQVLYHGALKQLGGSLTFTQNEFHNACAGVYEESTGATGRFDFLRDNLGLVTHLKYNPIARRSVSQSSIVSPTVSAAPGLQTDQASNPASTNTNNWPVRLASVL
ncbi:Nst1p [Sugiyamaella lignohabitans]|uniref:Stress response protein NST1 n=1 Tax=Sugiyamaella lignohabitans TaxID=796027 RepID=A0A167CYP6_9ASCO|nr:Nst1p [Sugiyamaella lignohabitans]ANB12265.1 Nst1p [Sugiyamaella lignohabitans]